MRRQLAQVTLRLALAKRDGLILPHSEYTSRHAPLDLRSPAQWVLICLIIRSCLA